MMMGGVLLPRGPGLPCCAQRVSGRRSKTMASHATRAKAYKNDILAMADLVTKVVLESFILLGHALCLRRPLAPAGEAFLAALAAPDNIYNTISTHACIPEYQTPST